MKLTFDVESMTLGEVEEFETISGLELSELVAGRLPTKAMIALVYIDQRRANPDYTLDDARKVKIVDISVGEPDPTPPVSAAS